MERTVSGLSGTSPPDPRLPIVAILLRRQDRSKIIARNDFVIALAYRISPDANAGRNRVMSKGKSRGLRTEGRSSSPGHNPTWSH